MTYPEISSQRLRASAFDGGVFAYASILGRFKHGGEGGHR